MCFSLPPDILASMKMERGVSKEAVDVKERAPARTRLETLSRITQAAQRSRILRALLLSSSLASLEGCAGGLSVGKGHLVGIHAEERLRVAEDTLPSYEQMLEELNDAVGERQVMEDLERQHQYTAHAHEHEQKYTRYIGFEKLDISQSLVKKYIEQTVPQSWWANGHLGEMEVNPHFAPITKPGFEGKVEYGHCNVSGVGEPIKIEFTNKDLQQDKARGNQFEEEKVGTVFSVALHELTHGSDWRSSTMLQPKQVLAEMYLVHQAMKDVGRPKFEYPESIHVKDGGDKKAEMYAKMTEFFAEVMEEALHEDKGSDWQTWESAFADNLVARRGASKDGAMRVAHIVKTHLQWTDPSFEPWQAAQKRVEIITAMNIEHESKRFSHMLLEDIKDTQIATALSEAFKGQSWSEDDVLYQIRVLSGLDESVDGRFGQVAALRAEKGASSKVVSINSYFNSVTHTFLNIRANHLGIKNRWNQPFSVDLGNETVRGFNNEMATLSPAELHEFRAIALREIQILRMKSPASK